MESMLAALNVSQPETWLPPGEEGGTGEAPAEGATAETLTGEPAAAPLVETAASFELDVPTPPRLNAEGKKESGVLKMKVGSQAEADNVKFHVKRSAQLDSVQAELQERQADRTTLDFFDTKPVEGFAYLAQAKPNAARSFVTEYLLANPTLAAEVLGPAGYTVTAAKDPEALAALAELASIKLRDRTHKARLSHEQTAAQQEWNHTAGMSIRDVAVTAGIDLASTDFKMFAQFASSHIAEKFPHGATRDELALALQPLIQRTMLMLGGHAPAQAAAPTPSTATPPTGPATFAARDAQSGRFAKLQGGQTLATALAIDAKPNANETLEGLITRLGG